MKYIFLILGLVSIVGTTDAMHVNKSKKVGGTKTTKPFRAPNIKRQAWTEKPKQQAVQVKQVKKDDGKLPVIPENKKPAQVAPVIREARAQQKKEQINTQAANMLKVFRELQEQRIKFVELCKLEDEKAHEVAREYYMRHRWKHLEFPQLEEAFIDPEVKNSKMLLMLLRTLAGELQMVYKHLEQHPDCHRLCALHQKNFGRLLQHKFIQAVHADDIDLVHFLLLELKPDAKQAGSLIYPETIKKSGIYGWVYETFDKPSTKLQAILTYIEAVMPANNAQEQEIQAQDEEALTQALEKLVLFARGDA